MPRPPARRIRATTLLLSLILSSAALAAEPTSTKSPDLQAAAQKCLDRIGVDRGICVLVGSDQAMLGQAILSQATAAKSELIFYVQLPHEAQVEKCRREAEKAGLLGTRIYVERGDPSRIHLADNLADAVIVIEPVADNLLDDNLLGDKQELLRVLRPLGKLLLGNREITKPYPAGADDWTHAYHGPDNNPQSTDQLARAPYITQFLAGPFYVPFPEVTVTSQGRIFKAFGHVGYKERNWPWLNKLVAFNGYNGTLLWKRSLEEGFNIHRNTMIATPDVLYLADSKSCKLLDTASGREIGQILAPADAAGPVWKWMAMADGVLYALVGEEEFRDPTNQGNRTAAGWPWRPMTAGYDRADYVWGFGRTLFAVDLKTKKVLWQQTEDQPIDGRAVVVKDGKIYYYSHPNFLAACDARQGKLLWKNHDSDLLEAVGPHQKAQTARLGFSSSAYLKCGDQALYFSGPQRSRLVAASTEDGRLLWQLPHGNYQLIVRPEGLYAMGRQAASHLLDPLTGEIRAQLDCVRGNCTRATGTVDSIFCRGHDHAGTLRLTLPDHQPRRIAPMRPDCHDGVIAAGGMLYWGPWMCDCSLSLVGNICLAPAGDFKFQAQATDSERLETPRDAPNGLKLLSVDPGDWPAYRADNRRSASAETRIAAKVKLVWRHVPPQDVDSTAPVTAGGLTFVAGSDGLVHALDGDSGNSAWKAYTAGPILFPPAVYENRLFVGSGDGFVYAFEAATGKRLWRFRAAPVERKIATYGRLTSTWPVASGVLVDKGTVYAAAGIASYDGTHVYALDATTGKIRWQNNSSGHMFGPDRVTGVSVQGHLLLHQDRLYMAGGNVISPAVYDTKDGRCLNQLVDEWGGQTPPADPNWVHNDQINQKDALQKRWGKAPRGCELFLVDGQVTAFDRLLYSPKEYWIGRYFPRQLMQAGPDQALIRAVGDRVARLAPSAAKNSPPQAAWEIKPVQQSMAIAVAANAVLLAGNSSNTTADADHGLTAHSLEDGTQLWTQPLSASPIWWGIATDHAGHVFVTLQDGSLVAFGHCD